MARDPETLAHQEWIGYVQPVGLVVSIPALLGAQAHVNRNIAPVQARFISCLPRDKADEVIAELRDFSRFVTTVFDWKESDLLDAEPLNDLHVVLPEYHETLKPTFAVKDVQPKDAKNPWLMLIKCMPVGGSLDEIQHGDTRHWQASAHAKFERLLRETEVPLGLLSCGTHLRMVYAPRGETSGYLTFGVAEMATVAGRPILAAIHMLLEEPRLFTMADKQRLPAILVDSRKFQNVVSTQLAEQVLAALFELLRGFQAADDATKGELLRAVLAGNPNQVYAGLLTVLMRLVFILYAEDRGLLSSDSVYANYYSVTGLFDHLRADAGRYPDTMNQRYGAWAQLLTLFRLVHEGGSHAGFSIPARKGYLFDPDRYPFLEGRTLAGPAVPRVPDGVVFQVLANLLILDGERLSYRTLDVEQIGSVYETIMGFNLEVACGRSIAIKPVKSHGAPTSINLEELLASKSADRAKWMTERTGQKLTGQAAEALKNASTIDDLLAALEKKIAAHVTPNTVPKGAMIFQPSDERRRSGSHYTPRSLTEPIVKKTLEPTLRRLGFQPDGPTNDGLQTHPTPANPQADSLKTYPTPADILALKICDPAMGSGAFLVEVCRQLAAVLVKSWHIHDLVPKIPADEDELLHAGRLIAQRCLYGVDKNPMAVDLAKLSLWLATLAKDHPFTFLDHALRHGDSLVGLTKEQIRRFHWEPGEQQMLTGQERLVERIESATRSRQEIIEAGDEVPFLLKQQKLALAEESLNPVRFAGNLVVAAFFAGDNDKKRKAKREEILHPYTEYLKTGNMALRPTKVEQELRWGDKAVQPFHWEIEFPEVFGREKGGFDAMVGNPPFLGGSKISSNFGQAYLDWVLAVHQESHGNADLVAHFFRRALELLRNGGAFGFIATNTIAQGDTRHSGLRWICLNGGHIYFARRRYKWPGQAAVVVSVVNIAKLRNSNAHDTAVSLPRELDGREVERISAYLFPLGGHEDPARLTTNKDRVFGGAKIYGQGFVLTPEETALLVAKDQSNAERILPYIGGEEINDEPRHLFHRHVINFGTMSLEEAAKWPDLLAIVEQRVKPERDLHTGNAIALRQRQYWWRYRSDTPNLFAAIGSLSKCLVHSQVSSHLAFAFVSNSWLYSHALNVFAFDTFAAFCLLQSRIHEIWCRFFGSSMKDDLRYTPSDCFETFAFPESSETDAKLEDAGRDYYEFRAAHMVKNNEGLTKTYNRFHEPTETSAEIQKLRELHAAMDRAVLDAYDWTDLRPTSEFLLDYEEEEDEEESGRARKKKKPWRYRWPDEFRDEVLARLLELNKKRAEEERLAGEGAQKTAKRGTRKPKR
jgi:hypothetical protein